MYIKQEFDSELSPVIKQKIIEFSEQKLPSTIDTMAENYLGSYLYNDNDELVGGITGHTYWNIMHVDFFWIDDSVRGEGLGTQLLKSMEEIARTEKCKVIHLETFSFQAPRFYEKQGYELLGVINNVPVDDCDYFFFKKSL